MSNVTIPYNPMVLDTAAAVLASGVYWRCGTVEWDCGAVAPGSGAVITDAAGNTIARFDAPGPHTISLDHKAMYNGLTVSAITAGTKLLVEWD